MADDVIDRNARGVLVALVADGRRNHATTGDFFADEIVDRGRGDARFYKNPNHIKDFSGHAPSGAHACKVRIFIDADAVLGDAASDVVHG